MTKRDSALIRFNEMDITHSGVITLPEFRKAYKNSKQRKLIRSMSRSNEILL